MSLIIFYLMKPLQAGHQTEMAVSFQKLTAILEAAYDSIRHFNLRDR